MTLYIQTTKDRYELPLVVAESIKELSYKTGMKYKTVKGYIAHRRKGWIRVEVEEWKTDMA